MALAKLVEGSATKAALYRGEELVRAHAVHGLAHTETHPGIVQVDAHVDGNASSTFKVNVTLDLNADRVLAHTCTCPVGTGRPSMCKHSVAAALAYLHEVEEDGADAPEQDRAQNGETDDGAPPSGARMPRDSGRALLRERQESLVERYRRESQKAPHPEPSASSSIPEPRTSPQISRLMYAYASSGPNVQPEPETSVASDPADVEVTVSPARSPHGSTDLDDQGVWEVKLRVFNSRQGYVVKDVLGMLGAWDAQAPFAYGKNLSFTHSRASFTDRANAVLGLLARAARTQLAARCAERRDVAAPAPHAAKSVFLGAHDAFDLLDALLGSHVLYEPRVLSGSARARTLDVVDADPALEMSMARGQRGGYDLQLPAAYDCVCAPQGMYVLLDGAAWRCSEDFRAAMGTFCSTVLPAGQTLHIRQADLAGFCSTVLPVLKERTSIELPADLGELMPEAPQFAFSLDLERERVVCRASVSYGERSLGLYEPIEAGQPFRDVAREREVRDLVDTYLPERLPAPRPTGISARGAGLLGFPQDDARPAGGLPCFDAQDPELMYRFLTDGLRALSLRGTVSLSEELAKIEVRPAPRVRVEATIKSGLLDIIVDSSDLAPAELMAYLSSYQRHERFFRLSNGDVLKLDGGSVKALAELADGLGIDATTLLDGPSMLPANRALFVDAIMKQAEGVRFDRDEGFRSIIRDFDSVNDNDFVEPDNLRDLLRPYQRDGFKWLCTLDRLGFGGILADDMGLGKTVQVIAYLLRHYQDAAALPRDDARRAPSLVVCPASLVYNWMQELARFAPTLRCAAVVGAPAQRHDLLENAWSHDVLVTSYELLKHDIEDYDGITFYCQVLDEAQYIKNHTTQAARRAKRVRAQVRFALTGTPIENRLGELWSIFDFLMPNMLGGYEQFRKRFEVPVASGDEDAAKRLQCMVGPFVLRRMKADVLKDLPEKNENIVFAHMEEEQERLYRATTSKLALQLAHQLPGEFASNRIAILAELTRLRQICCDPHLVYDNYEGTSAKLETCLELVANAVDGGHKVLVFSQFTSMLDIIAARLAERRTPYHLLVGSTPKEERARLVASFGSDDVPVFLISLKAGGVGLNLTAADIVIHYDPWWNLAAQNQATDRAHRIGQTSTVNVMRLIAKDTIEEKIVQLQNAKQDLAESIIGGEAARMSSLTKEDILALLEP